MMSEEAKRKGIEIEHGQGGSKNTLPLKPWTITHSIAGKHCYRNGCVS